MSEVRIKQKFYKKLETLTVSKLEHIRQLAQIEVDNYRVFTINPSEGRKKLVLGYMLRLEETVTFLDVMIKNKRAEVPFPSK